MPWADASTGHPPSGGAASGWYTTPVTARSSPSASVEWYMIRRPALAGGDAVERLHPDEVSGLARRQGVGDDVEVVDRSGELLGCRRLGLVVGIVVVAAAGARARPTAGAGAGRDDQREAGGHERTGSTEAHGSGS